MSHDSTEQRLYRAIMDVHTCSPESVIELRDAAIGALDLIAGLTGDDALETQVKELRKATRRSGAIVNPAAPAGVGPGGAGGASGPTTGGSGNPTVGAGGGGYGDVAFIGGGSGGGSELFDYEARRAIERLQRELTVAKTQITKRLNELEARLSRT